MRAVMPTRVACDFAEIFAICLPSLILGGSLRAAHKSRVTPSPFPGTRTRRYNKRPIFHVIGFSQSDVTLLQGEERNMVPHRTCFIQCPPFRSRDFRGWKGLLRDNESSSTPRRYLGATLNFQVVRRDGCAVIIDGKVRGAKITRQSYS